MRLYASDAPARTQYPSYRIRLTETPWGLRRVEANGDLTRRAQNWTNVE
jgi:hypothetical protein